VDVLDEIEARERRSFDAAEPTWALWEVMRTATDVGHAIAARMSLPYNDVRALELLAASETPLGPVELGMRLGMRSASSTELVDRLEAGGYVRRTRHPTDRRRVVVEMTGKGRKEALAALAPLLARFDRVVAGFDPDENRAVVAYLRAVAAEQRAFCAKDAEGA
jgi:DNA-binding MarR family transcriptional regulator